MTGHRRGTRASGLLCAFIAAALGIPLSVSYYPVQIIAGESSPGTWMSGFLLAASAAFALALAALHGSRYWTGFAAFFALLALDERFQFHEHLKARILFAPVDLPPWCAEAPVLAGAFAGLIAALQLHRHLHGVGRTLLLAAVLLGGCSVAIDLAHAGVFWEELLKILAELSLASALLGEIARHPVPPSPSRGSVPIQPELSRAIASQNRNRL